MTEKTEEETYQKEDEESTLTNYKWLQPQNLILNYPVLLYSIDSKTNVFMSPCVILFDNNQ